MHHTYSSYEAKARLSELLNKVRNGDTVTITDRGAPVAEIRPIQRQESPLSTRLDDLRRNGIITGGRSKPAFQPLATRPGALRRFLKSRE